MVEIADKTLTPDDPGVAADLAELTSLLGETMRGLKSAGPPPRSQSLRDAIEDGELNKRHMPALLAVAAAGPLSVSDLARRLGLQLSSTSTIVGDLSRAGLVQRAEDSEDRRRTIVRLHDDYRETMVAWLEVATGPLRNTLERLTPEARAHFMEGWRMLSEEAASRVSDHELDGC
jgi:DNA-binding MarR family transcriptional regulator